MKPQTLLRLTGATLVASLVFALSPVLSAQTAGTYVTNGQEKLRQGDNDGAIADYTKAIELNSGLPGAYLGRGTARSTQGNYDGAIADFGEALKLKPGLAEGYFGRGGAEFLQGNLDAGIADFTKAIELKPDYHAAYFQRGLARGCQTNLLGATEDLDKAIDPKMSNNSLNDYAVLYSNLFGMRMGHAPDSRVLAPGGWSGTWTKTLAMFLTRQANEGYLMNVASTGGGDDKGLQQGEARYFVGVLKLLAGDKTSAKADFQKCTEVSNDATVVHRLARTELDHL